jgi:hypothetical protein
MDHQNYLVHDISFFVSRTRLSLFAAFLITTIAQVALYLGLKTAL